MVADACTLLKTISLLPKSAGGNFHYQVMNCHKLTGLTIQTSLCVDGCLKERKKSKILLLFFYNNTSFALSVITDKNT